LDADLVVAVGSARYGAGRVDPWEPPRCGAPPVVHADPRGRRARLPLLVARAHRVRTRADRIPSRATAHLRLGLLRQPRAYRSHVPANLRDDDSQDPRRPRGWSPSGAKPPNW